MIIYGKGNCILKYSTEILQSVVIKYRGNPKLNHNHLSVDAMLGGDKVLMGNYGSKSLLIQGNNQIHIGFMDGAEKEFELFKYTGLFTCSTKKELRKKALYVIVVMLRQLQNLPYYY